jgi:hypothetical protein
VGTTEPGRVKEVGFFAHSWPGGPILFNTSDNSATNARDPSDFDARTKDFKPVNRVGWPDMKAAMSSSGTWHVWGCSATRHNLNLVQTAQKNQKLAEDKHFTVETTTTTHHGTVSQTIAERTTRARIRADMDTRFRSSTSTYMAAAAASLGIPVFGPPPGVGASYHSKLGIMYIDTAYYSVLYSYFATEFGPEFAPTHSTYDTGYVDYTALAKRAAPAAAPFSSEYYHLMKNFAGSGKTWLTFADGRSIERKGASSFTFKVTAKTDFATAGKSGHQYELHDSSDASNSCAVYMQADAKLFRVDKDGTGKFTVLGPEL